MLRAEKGYIIVGQDTDGTVTPDDAGLDWAVGKKKTDFVGIRGLTRPDLVAAGPQAARRPEDEGSEDRAGGGRADRRRPEPADPDEDDRPCHVELLVGKLRPLDRAGAGRRRARPHGRDAVRADAVRRDRGRGLRAWCSSTRRGTASMAKAAQSERHTVRGAERRPGSTVPTQGTARAGRRAAAGRNASRCARRTASVAALSEGARADACRQSRRPRPRRPAARALWLGPDEWLVIDEAGNDPLADLRRRRSAALGGRHFPPQRRDSRSPAPAAATTINAGCPQDLSLAAFPVGACSRTVLGKVEIVLLRTAEDAFRVECWRSFSDYVYLS